MTEVRYTKDHEWIRVDGDIATVGITHYAQEQLGDIVFVELPDVGKKLKGRRGRGGRSVKAASEVYAPVSGEVIEVNGALADDAGDRQRRRRRATAGSSSSSSPTSAELDGLMDDAAYKPIRRGTA